MGIKGIKAACACRRAVVVRMGKLEATAEEARGLHIDALAEQRAGSEDGTVSAASALLFPTRPCPPPQPMHHRPLHRSPCAALRRCKRVLHASIVS